MCVLMKTLREIVKKELVKAMKEAEVTNAELARRMDCSPVTSLLMIQEDRNLQLDTVERLARALGCRVKVSLVKNGSSKKPTS
jgi:plasmid maintenance system antidote protein VapI